MLDELNWLLDYILRHDSRRVGATRLWVDCRKLRTFQNELRDIIDYGMDHGYMDIDLNDLQIFVTFKGLWSWHVSHGQ